MSIMRFEVPQFIEVEDKIIGPFTWRQFIYLAGGGGAAVVLFFTLPLFLFALTGLPIAVLAGFLAFHQVNNRPFADFLESGFGYFTRNKLYLWRKENEQTLESERVPLEETDAPIQAVPASSLPEHGVNNIASLSRRLELDALENPQQPA